MAMASEKAPPGKISRVSNLFHALTDRLAHRNGLGNEYDRQTIAVMERVLKPDSNCIDIGASRGELLKHMVRLSPRGTHFAFEPLPQFYHRLSKKFPGVRVYKLALSDTEGESAFQHVVTNPAYSGLRRRRYDRPDERVEEIRVQTNRLDNIVPPGLTFDFVKLDVEGGEFKVLSGSIKTLRRDRPFIVFEFGMGAADYYGTEPEALYRLLTSVGLEVSLMADWLAGGSPLKADEFVKEFREYRNYYFLAHPRT